MTAQECLKYIVKELHTVVFSTVDEKGYPVTCAIDMMDGDESSLYFLTARGKQFFSRLKANRHIAFTALRGKDTLSSIAVSVQGEVKELGSGRVEDLFQKNSYMYEIYPTRQSREALTVFQIYRGRGEWFDLSKKPIERFDFSFGEASRKQEGYVITRKCIHCGVCSQTCPQQCIDVAAGVIRQQNCLHCGNCYRRCPVKAVERRGRGDTE